MRTLSEADISAILVHVKACVAEPMLNPYPHQIDALAEIAFSKQSEYTLEEIRHVVVYNHTLYSMFAVPMPKAGKKD